MTKKELAEKAGITAVHLTRLEKGGTSEPAPETVQALADALDYPAEFFREPDCDELTTDAVSFRSLSSLSSRQRDAALAAGVIAFQLHDWVANQFSLPTSDLLDLRDEDPRAAADALRTHWGLGTRPIDHMIKLLEAKGVRVFALAEQHKNIDAFSCWHGAVPFIFLNTYKSAERSRFDAAHELGHLVLHVHGNTGNRDVEMEADTFASSFLIHRGDLVSHLPRIQSLDKLIKAKKRWGVSVTALARSAFDVGILSDWHYRSLCKQISSLGYRTKEPCGMVREKSVLWKLVFEALWKEGITRETAARALKLPVEEIELLIDGLVLESQTPGSPRIPTLAVV